MVNHPQWLARERVLLSFEEAWLDSAAPPSIQEFVDANPEVTGEDLLRELVLIDVEQRRRRGLPLEVGRIGQLRCPRLEGTARRELIDLAERHGQSHRPAIPPPMPTPVEDSIVGAAAAELPVIDTDWQGYRIHSILGEGSTAIVYRGWDERLCRHVAIKILKPNLMSSETVRQRMLREARSAARLQHAHIVSIYEINNTPQLEYVVTEYVEGRSLQQELEESPPTQRRGASLVADLADAMEHAHQRGIIHRDIKPANIMVAQDASPKLTDFGLARVLEGQTELTVEGDLVGTPAYMAPEQAKGEGYRADARTDVYGLGAVLYRIITGRPPFVGKTAAVLCEIIASRPAPPRQIQRGVDADLERVCMKCLEQAPEHRYQSAADLASDLRRYLRGDPIAARRTTLLARLWHWSWRHPLAATLSVSFALVVATLLGVALRMREIRDQRDRARVAEQTAETARRRSEHLMIQSAEAAGYLALRQGRMETAIGHLRNCLGVEAARSLKNRLAIVESLLALREIDAAANELETIGDEPRLAPKLYQDGRWAMWQAELALEDPDSRDVAVRHFQQALDLGLDEADRRYVEGMLAERSIEAVGSLRDAWQHDPFHFRARRVWLTIQFSLSRYASVGDQLPIAKQMMPDDPALTVLAALLAAAQDQEVDLAALGERLPPATDVEALGKTLETVESLARAPWPDVAGFDVFWMKLATDADDWSGQAVSLRAAGLRLPPRLSAEFDSLITQLQNMQGGIPLSVSETLAKLVEAHPEGSLLTLLGDLYLRRGEMEFALGAFERAMNADALVRSAVPNAAKGVIATALRLGVIEKRDRELHLQKFVVAARSLDPVVIEDPGHCNAFVTGALEAGDLALARIFIRRWHDLLIPDERPPVALLWNELIMAQREDNPVKVIAWADRILEQEPEHQAARDARSHAQTLIEQSGAKTDRDGPRS